MTRVVTVLSVALLACTWIVGGAAFAADCKWTDSIGPAISSSVCNGDATLAPGYTVIPGDCPCSLTLDFTVTSRNGISAYRNGTYTGQGSEPSGGDHEGEDDQG